MCIGILILIALAAYTFAPAVIRRTARAVDQVPVILDGLSTSEIATDIGDKYGWSDEQKARLKTVLLRHKGNFQGLQDWIDRSLSPGGANSRMDGTDSDTGDFLTARWKPDCGKRH